jgi:surfactin synthase thioesterase subunit
MKKLKADTLINFNMPKIHMIGYSLGAHLAYNVAKLTNENSWFSADKIARLTGLDPSGMFKYGDFLFLFFNVNTFNKGHAV